MYSQAAQWIIDKLRELGDLKIVKEIEGEEKVEIFNVEV